MLNGPKPFPQTSSLWFSRVPSNCCAAYSASIQARSCAWLCSHPKCARAVPDPRSHGPAHPAGAAEVRQVNHPRVMPIYLRETWPSTDLPDLLPGTAALGASPPTSESVNWSWQKLTLASRHVQIHYSLLLMRPETRFTCNWVCCKGTVGKPPQAGWFPKRVHGARQQTFGRVCHCNCSHSRC